ncbi:TPA: hypothetical protein ACK3Q6_001648 [Burkholderia cepacia]|uniref:hypothetical protein n=1 Tax=Burkholderia cepacia TaxID=292 RepID=UPI001CF17728|nr:hypothetical protein [Burkholderia cepacia]MCA8363167.1 hypothetical protein [Burkholderia cepacia]HDR9756475.1 hypothetical protein [Burkholderia cepacia ATCC 25416]HDV6364692.1 hypothetical protein [Burkholderia cepacia]
MNTIAELRAQLLSTLEKLNDANNPMDIERAKVVADVAQVIINSAKVEVEHLKVTKGIGTGFIPDRPSAEPGNGITSVTRHLIDG